jgi:hypothetical protein
MNRGASSFLRLKILVCTLAAVGAYGQPMMTLQFCNDCLPSPPDRLVRDVNGNPLVGTNYVAQLYSGMDPVSLFPTTAAPARFKPAGTTSPGTWQRITRNFLTPAAGPYYIQVRVWDTVVAPTYEQAAASPIGQYGRSEVFLFTPCPQPPQLPPPGCEMMRDFRGFTLMTNPPDRVLAIRENGDRVDVLYQGTHTIQAATALNGPWTTVHSSTAPFTDPSSETNNLRFYRMRDDPGPSYSLNAVGYYRLNICAGFTLIANQLHAPGVNTVTNVFKAPPIGVTVYKFNPGAGGYEYIEFINGFGWYGDDLSLSLGPGEGVFIFARSDLTHTFVGDVPRLVSVPVPTGWSILSSPTPQGAPLTDEPPSGLGFPVRNGDQVYQFRGCGQTVYIVNEYIEGFGWFGSGEGATPVINIGESFFFFRTGASGPGVWNRSFSVGQ